jgi:hypothetical protein
VLIPKCACAPLEITDIKLMNSRAICARFFIWRLVPQHAAQVNRFSPLFARLLIAAAHCCSYIANHGQKL